MSLLWDYYVLYDDMSNTCHLSGFLTEVFNCKSPDCAHFVSVFMFLSYHSYHRPKQKLFLSKLKFFQLIHLHQGSKSLLYRRQNVRLKGTICFVTSAASWFLSLPNMNSMVSYDSFVLWLPTSRQWRERKSPERNQLIFCHGTSKVNGWTFLQQWHHLLLW